MGTEGEIKVIVVGAGLVGTLAAIYMSRLGHDVEIYERRKDSRAERLLEGRSIKLALSQRGILALREVGLDQKVLAETVPLKARMIHGVAKEDVHTILYGDFGETIQSISRHRLNEVLLEAAEREPRVRIFFEHELTSMDMRKRPQLHFTNIGLGGTIVKADCDFVLGCDGAFSAVRRELMKLTPLNFSQEYTRHGYKEFYIPAGPQGEFRMPKGYLHIWPRKEFMLISLPNTDGSFTASLFYPQDAFNTICCDEDAIELFRSQFPDVLELMGEKAVCESFRCNPVGSLVTMRCSSYHYEDKLLLLGDAAHAMVPFFGQGMNAGFEDLSVLLPLLKSSFLTRSAAFAEFSRVRVPDAKAICDMALLNYWEVSSGVASRIFRLKKRAYGIMHQLLPKTILPLYTMVAFTNMAYSRVYQRHRLQERLVNFFAIALFLSLVVFIALLSRQFF